MTWDCRKLKWVYYLAGFSPWTENTISKFPKLSKLCWRTLDGGRATFWFSEKKTLKRKLSYLAPEASVESDLFWDVTFLPWVENLLKACISTNADIQVLQFVYYSNFWERKISNHCSLRSLVRIPGFTNAFIEMVSCFPVQKRLEKILQTLWAQ